MRVVPHREHDQVHRKPRQPAFSHPHDHSRPGERGQGLAPGQEPRARRPEGGWPRQQDGLRDLPDTTPGHQGETLVTLSCCVVLGGVGVYKRTKKRTVHTQNINLVTLFVKQFKRWKNMRSLWPSSLCTLDCHPPRPPYFNIHVEIPWVISVEKIIQMYSSIPSGAKEKIDIFLFVFAYHCSRVDATAYQKRAKRKRPTQLVKVFL